MTQQPREKWHVGREIPLALVAAIMIQTGGAVWWASGINERVKHVEQQSLLTQTRLTALDTLAGDQRVQIARLVEQMQATNENLEDLKDNLAETNQLLRTMFDGP